MLHPDYPIDFKPAIARIDWDQTYDVMEFCNFPQNFLNQPWMSLHRLPFTESLAIERFTPDSYPWAENYSTRLYALLKEFNFSPFQTFRSVTLDWFNDEQFSLGSLFSLSQGFNGNFNQSFPFDAGEYLFTWLSFEPPQSDLINNGTWGINKVWRKLSLSTSQSLDIIGFLQSQHKEDASLTANSFGYVASSLIILKLDTNNIYQSYRPAGIPIYYLYEDIDTYFSLVETEIKQFFATRPTQWVSTDDGTLRRAKYSLPLGHYPRRVERDIRLTASATEAEQITVESDYRYITAEIPTALRNHCYLQYANNNYWSNGNVPPTDLGLNPTPSAYHDFLRYREQPTPIFAYPDEEAMMQNSIDYGMPYLSEQAIKDFLEDQRYSPVSSNADQYGNIDTRPVLESRLYNYHYEAVNPNTGFLEWQRDAYSYPRKQPLSLSNNRQYAQDGYLSVKMGIYDGTGGFDSESGYVAQSGQFNTVQWCSLGGILDDFDPDPANTVSDFHWWWELFEFTYDDVPTVAIYRENIRNVTVNRLYTIYSEFIPHTTLSWLGKYQSNEEALVQYLQRLQTEKAKQEADDLVDSIRVKQIHATLGAGEYAVDDLGNDPYMNIARRLEWLANAYGVAFNLDGSVLAVPQRKNAKVQIDPNNNQMIANIPDGYLRGQFDDYIHTDGKVRLGILYQNRSNEYETWDDNDPTNNLYRQGDLVMCNNMLQYWESYLEDLDKGLNWQEMGASILPSADGTRVCAISGMGTLLAEVAYMLSSLSNNIYQSHTLAIKAYHNSLEIMKGLGVPITNTVQKIEIGDGDPAEPTVGYLPLPKISGDAPSITQQIHILLENLGIIIGTLNEWNNEPTTPNP